MTPKTLTIHIIDLPGGGVSVHTNAATPHVGQRHTPASALAMDLLTQCVHRASDVRNWGRDDPAYALAAELLDPEGFFHAVTPEVRDAARRVLGRAPVETLPRQAEAALVWPTLLPLEGVL